MQLEVISHQNEQLGVLPTGKFWMKRHKCKLPGDFSEAIARHLRSVESQQSPLRGLWRCQHHEIEQLKATRAVLLQTYERLGHWQTATIGLALILGTAHMVVALTVAANIAYIAPVGGSALLFGSGCTGMLRYLAKERKAAMSGYTQITNSLATCQSMANAMLSKVS